MRENHLRHRRRRVGRDVRDWHTARPGGGEVDDVVAGGQHAAVTQLGQAPDRLGTQDGFVREHDLGVGSALDH